MNPILDSVLGVIPVITSVGICPILSVFMDNFRMGIGVVDIDVRTDESVMLWYVLNDG